MIIFCSIWVWLLFTDLEMEYSRYHSSLFCIFPPVLSSWSHPCTMKTEWKEFRFFQLQAWISVSLKENLFWGLPVMTHRVVSKTCVLCEEYSRTYIGLHPSCWVLWLGHGRTPSHLPSWALLPESAHFSNHRTPLPLGFLHLRLWGFFPFLYFFVFCVVRIMINMWKFSENYSFGGL